jgi:hypothetical protein
MNTCIDAAKATKCLGKVYYASQEYANALKFFQRSAKMYNLNKCKYEEENLISLINKVKKL